MLLKVDKKTSALKIAFQRYESELWKSL